ncbi:hypothetical protein Tco_0533505 [Tanacetum coccineum]
MDQAIHQQPMLFEEELVPNEKKILSRKTSQKKVEKLPYPRFTKLIIAHFLKENNTIAKLSNSLMHHTTQDEKLSKLKFESAAYRIYLTKSKNAPIDQSQPVMLTLRRGHGKDLDQDLELVVSMHMEEGRKTIEELKEKKERHETLMIGKEVDNEVNKGFNDQIKLKLKAVETIPPVASDDKIDDDDLYAGDDQTGTYGIHLYDKEQDQPTFKPLSPRFTLHNDTQTTFVVPIPKGNPEVTSYISGASEVPLGMNVDFEASCSVLQKLDEHEQRLNDLSKTNVAKVIKESFQANMINEVKNKLPKLEPDIVSDFIQPRLDSTMLHAL